MAYIHESNVTLFLVSMQWNFETNLTPFCRFCLRSYVCRTIPHVVTSVFFIVRFPNTLWDLHIFFFPRKQKTKHTHGYFHRYRAWRVHGHLHDWCDPERRGMSSSSRLFFFSVVVSVTTTRFYLCPIFVRTSPPRVVRFHFWEILAFSRILCDECSSLSLLKLALIITHDQYYQ